MREQLLGYLLSALEPHEMRAIDQRLQNDPQLRAELAEVQQMLAAFDQAVGQDDLVELPPGLTASTLSQLGEHPHPTLGDLPAWDIDQARNGPEAIATPAESQRQWFSSGDEQRVGRSRQAWSDLLVSAVAAVSLFALMLPMIVRYRSEVRKTVCQNNLRQLGMAFNDFVLRHGDTRLPAVAQSGHEAFSGIYEVRLADVGLMRDPGLRWCPEGVMPTEPCPQAKARGASALARYIATQPSVETTASSAWETKSNAPKTVPWHGLTLNHSSRAAELGDDAWKAVTAYDVIDSRHLMHAALSGDIARLKFLQRLAGGHYAYNLGVYENGRYRAPKFEGRSSFAILGDAPISGQTLGNDHGPRYFRWHHAGGANILYEDGSVRFVEPNCMRFVHDHPYLNHELRVEAGVHVDDATLAPSWFGPTLDTLQR